MITFRARMYNVTSGEYCDNTPTNYSFALYYGYTGSEDASSSSVSLLDWWLNGGLSQYFEPVALAEDAGQDVMLLKDGQTLTNIPYTRFSFQRSTNVGTWFEYYAKKYFDENSSWPVLRLLTSNDTELYYLEWDHTVPQGFYVKSEEAISRWDYSFQWTDSFNTQYSDDRKYNLYYSTIFCNSDNIADLVNPESLKYAGAFRFNETSGGIDTLVAVNTYNISVTNEDCLKYDAGTYLGRIDNRYFYKSYNGTTIAMFVINSATRWKGPITIVPYINNRIPIGWSPYFTSNTGGPSSTFTYAGITWAQWSGMHLQTNNYDAAGLPIFNFDNVASSMDQCGIIVSSNSEFLYHYLQGHFIIEPPSDVDPEAIPPEDELPTPIPPDEPDPYYDPTSDPTSPTYDPTKDPTSPSYDPSTPSTPYKPPSQPTILEVPVIQPTPSIIPTPETPPSYVTTNDLFTLFNPSGGDLTSIANFLWSPAWSVDTLKKIFANPLDCILGLLVLPHLQAPVDTKTMNIGNISTGISLHYFTSQFFDFDCGAFALPEYYQSYLDYAPYTKISIFLPYIGDQELNTDEVMGKNIGVKYRFDLATGDCIAFISIDGDVLYSFAGNCAARLPLSANNYAGIIPSITSAAIRASTIPSDVSAMGAAAALAVTAMKQTASHTGSLSGSAGLMGIQTPYLIVTRPRQALPMSQNSFKGYPSFITESLSQLSGYTEVDQVHLEHVPATGAELVEIERLLKEGVLF